MLRKFFLHFFKKKAAIALFFGKILVWEPIPRRSENVFDPKITATAVMWAQDLVTYLTKKMLFMADTYSYVDDFDKDCKKVLKVIRDAGSMVSKSKILRAVRRPADNIKRILDTLVEREIITETIMAPTNGYGRISRCYTLL